MRTATILLDTVFDSVTALRALPEALLLSLPPAPPPLRQALHLGRRASLAAQRAAWYSALALLASAARAQPDAQADAPPRIESQHFFAEGAAESSTPKPETWAAMLVVLAVIGAQAARRRGRGAFAG